MPVVVTTGKYLGNGQNICYPVCMKVYFVFIVVCGLISYNQDKSIIRQVLRHLLLSLVACVVCSYLLPSPDCFVFADGNILLRLCHSISQ